MGRLKYLNPFRIRNAVRDVRRSTAGGGPRFVRLLGISDPQGILIPVATATIEVEARDGHTELFQPTIPLPFPYAWTYRLAKALRVPIVRSIDPDRIRFQVPVPGGAGGDGGEPEESLEDAASPADRVTSADEEAEDRSEDERAEVLQDAAELKLATERARTERRNVERD